MAGGFITVLFMLPKPEKFTSTGWMEMTGLK